MPGHAVVLQSIDFIFLRVLFAPNINRVAQSRAVISKRITGKRNVPIQEKCRYFKTDRQQISALFGTRALLVHPEQLPIIIGVRRQGPQQIDVRTLTLTPHFAYQTLADQQDCAKRAHGYIVPIRAKKNDYDKAPA